MKLQWRATTRFHDWSIDDRAEARRILEHVRRLNVLGDVDWYTDPSHRRLPATPKITIDGLVARKGKRGSSYGFDVGGDRPTPWQLSMLLARWNPALGQLYGYDTLQVLFESEPFEAVDGSERLVHAFRQLHTSDNSEYASIHPYERASELRDINSRYESPLTLGPMFAGVLWANFLGPQQLAFFDQDKLHALSAYRFEFVPDESLFLQVSPDVARATSPEVEVEMFRLTDAFRAALR